MYIPLAWVKVTADATHRDGQVLPVSVWGWGENASSAKACGAERLQRAIERIGRGDIPAEQYAYGNRPLKEEILRTFDGATVSEPAAIVTRNARGELVLNAARLLFLDIDLPTPSLPSLFRRMFGGPPPEDKALTDLRAALQAYGRATFRVYRTAAGFRAIAIDHEFDPVGSEAQDLMRATN